MHYYSEQTGAGFNAGHLLSDVRNLLASAFTTKFGLMVSFLVLAVFLLIIFFIKPSAKWTLWVSLILLVIVIVLTVWNYWNSDGPLVQL